MFQAGYLLAVTLGKKFPLSAFCFLFVTLRGTGGGQDGITVVTSEPI